MSNTSHILSHLQKRYPPRTEFRRHVEQLFTNNGKALMKEYNDLEKLEDSLLDDDTNWITGKNDRNQTKNRYSDILPNESTRVKLMNMESRIRVGYINANYVSGEKFSTQQNYICAQAPLTATTSSFWQMIWENNVEIIFMLAKEKEGSTIKCTRYWPKSDGNDLTINGISIKLVEESRVQGFRDIIKRVISMEEADTSGDTQNSPSRRATRIVTQYQYTGWPDHGVPKSDHSFCELLSIAHDQKEECIKNQRPISPILVHCSAGVGRTGVFMTVALILEQLKQHRSTNGSQPFPFNIVETVAKLRLCRNHMIQTPEQYAFVHVVLLHELEKLAKQ